MARQSRWMKRLLAAAGGLGCTALAAGQTIAPGALKQMSLDELMSVEVTSVSRSGEAYSEAAAALAVVTAEHIERSGATTVPEALRNVPGLHVARQNANVWAVSSRGFSSVNSEKLLVLSDTRSIYTPLFSGVLWDVQDYLLADIERIEVIRGPGAALWGSNAVNGVINITTKHAADTHGTHVETIVGTEERAMIAARHGGETSGGVHFRVFGKFLERDDTFNPAATSDDWRLGHLGFRADWTKNGQDEFTVQGDAYGGTIGQLAPTITILGRPGPTGDLEARVAGGNLLARWRRQLDENSELQFRAYYDRTHRNNPSFTDNLETIDLDLQHRFAPTTQQQVTWGVNYRHTANDNEGKGIFAVTPETSKDDLYSAFVQDQVAITETLRATIGTKVEHNDFSGFEFQPSARAAWEIAGGHTLWAAVAQAVRIPTRLERDIAVDAADPASDPLPRLLGSEDFDAEDLVAYELGYRWRVLEPLFIDVALFQNDYDGLASLELGDPFIEPDDGRTVIPIFHRNLTDGRARGAEAHVTFAPSEQWKLSASYSYLDLELEPAGQDINRGAFFEGATPRHQFALSSYLDLPGDFQLDAHFRRHSAIRSLPDIVSGEGIAGYSELAVRLSWQATDEMRVSVVGQNLLHDRHVEFGTPEARGAIQRGVYLRIEWDL